MIAGHLDAGGAPFRPQAVQRAPARSDSDRAGERRVMLTPPESACRPRSRFQPSGARHHIGFEPLPASSPGILMKAAR
jgi:hypothetical protein